jgi:hypothetical protein
VETLCFGGVPTTAVQDGAPERLAADRCIGQALEIECCMSMLDGLLLVSSWCPEGLVLLPVKTMRA